MSTKLETGTKIYFDYTGFKGTLKFSNLHTRKTVCESFISHKMQASALIFTLYGLRGKDKGHSRKQSKGFQKTIEEKIFFQRAELGYNKGASSTFLFQLAFTLHFQNGEAKDSDLAPAPPQYVV